MPGVLKHNAVAVFALAALLCGVFMFAKHDPALRDVIPFGDDPYDAVGSFGVMVGGMIALLSLVRSFRTRPGASSAMQRLYLVRAQEAVVLTVFLTVAADAVAMSRHASMWMGAVSRDRLLALLSGLTIAAIAVQWLVCRSITVLPVLRKRRWIGAAALTLLSLLILAYYPERLIDRLSTHLLTVIVGDFVLFVPMRPLLMALVPIPVCDESIEKNQVHLPTAGWRWTIAALIGILLGFFAFAGEVTEAGSAPSMERLVLVGAVFVGLGLAGNLIAYALLGRPLGLGRG
jgi:hypothetical protein